MAQQFIAIERVCAAPVVLYVSDNFEVDLDGPPIDVVVSVNLEPVKVGSGVPMASLEPGDILDDTNFIQLAPLLSVEADLVSEFEDMIARAGLPPNILTEKGVWVSRIGVFVGSLVFHSYSGDLDRYKNVHRCERELYTFLLKGLGVDVGHHQYLMRTYADKFGLPTVLTEETKARLMVIKQEAEACAGLSFGAQGDRNRFECCERRLLSDAVGELLNTYDDPMSTDEIPEPLPPTCQQETGPNDASPGVTLKDLLLKINQSSATVDHGPGLFTVKASQVPFGDIVDYCLGISPKLIPGLPPRGDWAGVPYLLNNDRHKGGTGYEYVVTDMRSLAQARANCYSEIYLEGLPVTIVNFDIDKVRPLMGDTLDMTTLDEIVDTFLIFLRRACGYYLKCTKAQLQKIRLEMVGELAVYVRGNAMPDKFSARYVWQPPVEMCFCHIGELKIFVGMLKDIILAETSFYASHKETAAGTIVLECAVDTAPYSKNKSCRLPNGLKKNTLNEFAPFSFVKSYNQTIAAASPRGRESMCVGLSRPQIGYERLSLGGSFLKEAAGRFMTEVDLGDGGGMCKVPIDTDVPKEKLDKVVSILQGLWGSTKMVTQGNGSVRISPCHIRGKQNICLLHNRTHHNANFSVHVYSKHMYPKCFNVEESTVPFGHYPVLEIKEDTLILVYRTIG
nr:primase [Salmonid herpesvirus 1]